jgi:hypothetical protein
MGSVFSSAKISIFKSMSDQEVVKHGEKIIALMGNKEASFWQKMKDFFVEIVIIVFAVTLSIWFHNWSEHRNEQKVTKTFLLGLRYDIQTDIADTKDILQEYKRFEILYTFLSNLDGIRVPDKDSLKRAISFINTNTFLRPHKSRFNGFLSAGKIMTIENDSLTQNILTYYEEVLPELGSSEQGWLSENGLLNDYLNDHVKDFSNDISVYEVLATPKAKHISKSLIPWPQLLDRYQAVIVEGNKIIATIDKMYVTR